MCRVGTLTTFDTHHLHLLLLMLHLQAFTTEELLQDGRALQALLQSPGEILTL
jgi:hypothetical protein